MFRGKTPDWTGDVPEDFGALIKRCPGHVIFLWGLSVEEGYVKGSCQGFYKGYCKGFIKGSIRV